MSGDLDGRVAVVTGAASGIGAATARGLVASGARVVACDIDGDTLAELARELGAAVRPLALDVTDEEAVAGAVAAAEELGGIAILVNAAGVGSTTAAPDTPLEIWERVLAVNATGTFLCCKHAIPPMAARGRGTIVNVASAAALVGLRNRAAYCASKGAVVALTRALALDHVGDGIRVNAVCPGTVDTPWVRRLVEEAGESLEELRARQLMRRLGTADEIAAAILYLAGDAAGFVTGSALVIDGGLTAA